MFMRKMLFFFQKLLFGLNMRSVTSGKYNQIKEKKETS